jgi:hypothetical protein
MWKRFHFFTREDLLADKVASFITSFTQLRSQQEYIQKNNHDNHM